MAIVAKQKPAKTEGNLVMIEVPLCEPLNGTEYITRHVQLQLTERQGAVLKRLFKALDERGEQVNRQAQQRPIMTYAHAIAWLLDRIADDAE